MHKLKRGCGAGGVIRGKTGEGKEAKTLEGGKTEHWRKLKDNTRPENTYKTQITK